MCGVKRARAMQLIRPAAGGLSECVCKTARAQCKLSTGRASRVSGGRRVCIPCRAQRKSFDGGYAGVCV